MTECQHKWVYIGGKCRTKDAGWNTRWTLTERFHCEKCLETETTVAEETSYDPPTWWGIHNVN